MHEDGIDPSHGQRKDLAMDPDLADEWAAFPVVVDNAALTMARIAETVKDEKYPQAHRFLIGLTDGWEERKAAKVAARQQNPSTEEA